MDEPVAQYSARPSNSHLPKVHLLLTRRVPNNTLPSFIHTLGNMTELTVPCASPQVRFLFPHAPYVMRKSVMKGRTCSGFSSGAQWQLARFQWLAEASHERKSNVRLLPAEIHIFDTSFCPLFHKTIGLPPTKYGAHNHCYRAIGVSRLFPTVGIKI